MNVKTILGSTLGGAAVLVLIFLAGAASGVLVMRGPAPEGNTVRADFFEIVIDSLNVSAETRSVLDSILQARTEATNSVLEESVRRLQAMVDTTSADLRSALPEEEASHFDALVERLRTTLPPGRSRRPGGSR